MDEIENDLSKCMSRWPAVKFAISRTDKVIGRITFLVNSIRTITGINPLGVPNGTKWLRNLLVFRINLLRKILVQNVSPRGRTIDICEFAVKVKGRSARRLSNKSLKNVEDIREIVRFLGEILDISISILFLIDENIDENLEDKCSSGINNTKICVNHDDLILIEDGSNIEKRLVIIDKFLMRFSLYQRMLF